MLDFNGVEVDARCSRLVAAVLAEEFDRRTLSLCDQPGADRGLKTQVALERLVESVKRRRRCSKALNNRRVRTDRNGKDEETVTYTVLLDKSTNAIGAGCRVAGRRRGCCRPLCGQRRRCVRRWQGSLGFLAAFRQRRRLADIWCPPNHSIDRIDPLSDPRRENSSSEDPPERAAI